MMTPTVEKMVKAYVDAARIERLKTGRPGESTVKKTLQGVRAFRVWLNDRRETLGYERVPLDEDFPLVSIVKPTLVHKYLADMLRRGVKPITALSRLNQLRQLFAKWVLPYYEECGWKVPSFPFVGKSPRPPRYNRPDEEQIKRLKEWYKKLSSDLESVSQSRRATVPNQSVWFAATMMLEFAMRNGDIMRLQMKNFIRKDGRVYLNYMPHKTEHSSGRMVKWPIHADIWGRINALNCGSLPVLDDQVFDALNRQMRGLGFTGNKGAYELRKICIDHVYQKFGAEMAVSISGDDIRTIMHYYADPSQPNVENVRVIDLL